MTNMKQTSLFILFFSFWINFAQSPDHNWIKEKVYRIPTTQPIASPSINQAFVTVKYYDGLGRVAQEISHQMSPIGQNLVIHHQYDPLGREVKKYLPFPSSANDLNFVDQAGILTQQYYQTHYGSSIAYAETLLEDSPLNRIIKQAAPGDDWALGSGHEIKYDYDTNKGGEVRLFRANTTYDVSTDLYRTSLIDEGFYEPGTLYKLITANENHDLGGTGNTIEYKDNDGRLILKRQVTSQGNVDTYFVYDNFDHLIYIIPPLAAQKSVIDQDVLDNLCYQYMYDSHNRKVAQKLPGVRWIYTAYDRRDRPRATGPVKSPFSHSTTEGWLITKYDGLNRPVMTAFKPATVNEQTRLALQHSINTKELSENPVTQANQQKKIKFYYTSNSYPKNDYYILTISYYDNYRFWPQNQIPNPILNQPVRSGTQDNLKGLPTGQWVRILRDSSNNDHYTELIFYKDDPTMAVIGVEKHRGSGYHKQHHLIDFEGKILQTHTYHKMTPDLSEIHIREDFSYTDQGRLGRHQHLIYGHENTVLAEYTYDPTGRLKQKNLDQNLEEILFTHNIRGWLTEMQSAHFSMELLYDKGAYPLYNGNISAQRWRSSSDNQTRRYDYRYDALNRLTEAQFTNETRNLQGSYDVSLSYDKQGNIQDVERWGLFELQQQTIDIDNLL